MAFGIPRESERRMGVSFGFHERSSVGYEVENTHLLDTPGYYDLFRGKGGLSSVYLGYGVELFNDFLLGANLNYTFGSVSALQAKIFPYTADLLSFSDEFLYYYRGINVDLGVHYTVQDSLFHKWKLSHSFAATLSSKTNLKGKGFQYAETFFGIPYYNDQRIITVDTVKYEENLQTSARIPVCFGFAYTLSNAKSWGLSLEFETSKWSTITSSLNGQAFYDNKRYSIGFYWVPELDFSVKEDFWKKTEYRAGLRYEQLYYNFFGQQINEIGISFGLGLPITKSITLIDDRVNLLNHVDIGFEYMTRGTTDHDLIEEQYFILNIGLNFNDKWFIKRKYL
jgi:hypothetical protein